ncbi:MAG: hypothetical protein HQK62_15305, partial [Desulfamplus sp.]|nr:hypothetical protein [Desulfamplus sp.]
TTQTPEYVERFDIEKQSINMHNYLESFRWQLAAVSFALGHSNVHELCRNDLVALTPEAAALTRLPYAPEYAASSCFNESGSCNAKENSNSKTKKRKQNGTAGKVRETGTANFSKHSRSIIKQMSRSLVQDSLSQQKIMEMALQGRENPFPAERAAHLDDVVFLSAALTRLVIDPYREDCSTKTRIVRTVEIGQTNPDTPFVDMELPFLFTGFDEAPDNVKAALFAAISSCGCGYIGRRPLVTGNAIDYSNTLVSSKILYNGHALMGTTKNESPIITADSREFHIKKIPAGVCQERPHKSLWFQLILPGDTPSPEADALIYVINNVNTLQKLNAKRLCPNQLIGLCADVRTLPAVLPHALSNVFDILLLDTTLGIKSPWVEINSSFDLTVIRDTILRLRSLNMEEEICLINFGGLRSGTDVAKSLALNCNASVFGVAMAIALGGRINGNSIEFPSSVEKSGSSSSREQDLRANRNRLESEHTLFDLAVNWIKGTVQETAIIARCAGKTNIHNLEPEDMRSISIATSEALGIPLTSGALRRHNF